MVFYGAHLSYLACDKRQSRRSIKEMVMRISLPGYEDRPGEGEVNFMNLLQRVFLRILVNIRRIPQLVPWFCSLSPRRRRNFVPKNEWERVVYWPLPISEIKGKAVYKGLTTGYWQPRGCQSFTVSRTPFFSCLCLFAKSTLFVFSCLLRKFPWRSLLNSSLDKWTDSTLYDKIYSLSLAGHLCFTDCDCCTLFVYSTGKFATISFANSSIRYGHRLNNGITSPHK